MSLYDKKMPSLRDKLAEKKEEVKSTEENEVEEKVENVEIKKRRLNK